MELELKGGGVLRFAISVPEQTAEKVPLVLALHYGGEVTPFYGKAYMGVIRSHWVIGPDGKVVDEQLKISPAKSVELGVASLQG